MALVGVMIGAFLLGSLAMVCFGFFALRQSGLTAVLYEDTIPAHVTDLSEDERARLNFIRWLQEQRTRRGCDRSM